MEQSNWQYIYICLRICLRRSLETRTPIKDSRKKKKPKSYHFIFFWIWIKIGSVKQIDCETKIGFGTSWNIKIQLHGFNGSIHFKTEVNKELYDKRRSRSPVYWLYVKWMLYLMNFWKREEEKKSEAHSEAYEGSGMVPQFWDIFVIFFFLLNRSYVQRSHLCHCAESWIFFVFFFFGKSFWPISPSFPLCRSLKMLLTNKIEIKKLSASLLCSCSRVTTSSPQFRFNLFLPPNATPSLHK